MRLGNYPCHIASGTLAERVYCKNTIADTCVVYERHRHRFEFNRAYREPMEKAGFLVSATSPDGMLAEIVEIVGHPYMIGTQAHPEFNSRPTRPHPLFAGLIDAIIEQGKV